jgi:hypothetical protein
VHPLQSGVGITVIATFALPVIAEVHGMGAVEKPGS